MLQKRMLLGLSVRSRPVYKGVWPAHAARLSTGGVSMMRWKRGRAGVVAVVLSAGLFTGYAGQAEAGGTHPATGVGSCTLKSWNPSLDARNAQNSAQDDGAQH